MKTVLRFHLLISFLVISSAYSRCQYYNFPSDTNFFDIRNAFYTNYDGSCDTASESSTFRQFQRWENFWGPRLAPSGSFKIAGEKWGEFINNDLYNLRDNQSIPSNWTELGPKQNGIQGIGRIDAIEFHPTDTNTMLAGSPAGGLFISYDLGQNWSIFNTDYQLARLGVSTIAYDSDDPSIIYIGTGDHDSGFSYSDGVYRSTDNGVTWQPINNGLFTANDGQYTIGKLLVDPSNDSIMFVATTVGIYKCENRQSSVPTWSKVYPDSLNNYEYIRNIIFKNSDPNIVYAVGQDIIMSTQGGDAGTWYRFATSFNGLDFTGAPWPNAIPDEYVEILNIESTPKSQKEKYATKSPRHQGSQSAYYRHNFFCDSLCFRDFVAKKYFSEWTQYCNFE